MILRHKVIIAIGVAATALAAIAATRLTRPVETPSTPAADTVALADSAAEAWADSVMATLTPDDRLRQLIIPRYDFTDTPQGLAAIARAITTTRPGGILMGKGTLRDYAAIINEAQRVSKVPLLITLDGEWGPAMRVTDAPVFPYNMTLGAIRDPQLLYLYGREVGRQCRLLGINVDFAPVLDVNSNPSNPVIGKRSFGEDHERVAQLGIAFSQGLESMGVMSVAKHFPGHGNTSVDSHKALPTLAASRQELEATELLPFRRYTQAGLQGMMVGHLSIPALDKTGTPASLSKSITTGLLKEEIGFDGLIFTDALAMKGALRKGGNNCVDAFLAGTDMLLQPSEITTDLSALNKALADGRITQTEIDARCRKLLIYKYKLGAAHFKPIDVANVKAAVCSPMADGINQMLAKASATLLRNSDNLLPLTDLRHSRIALAIIGGNNDSPIVDQCAKYAPIFPVVASKDGSLTSAQLSRLADADVVIAAILTDNDAAVASFKALQKLGKVINVFFTLPYSMRKFLPQVSTCSTLLTLFQPLPAQQRAAADAIFGGIKVDGIFPVNVSGVAGMGQGITTEEVRLGFATPAAMGMNPNLQQQIDSIVSKAIAKGAMTGAQVLVVNHGQIVIDSAYGHIDTEPGSPKVTNATLFDLASVTKTHATLLGVMKCVDEGLFKTTDPIGRYITELDSTDKADITVADLLYHQSGLPPTINIYRLAFDPESYTGPLVTTSPKGDNTIKIGDGAYGNTEAKLRSEYYSTIADEELFPYPVARGLYVGDEGIDAFMHKVHNARRGSRSYEYSCLNFIMLKELQEEVTGVDLDQWVDTEIYAPLGAWHTTYNPLQRFTTDEIAATENDTFLRRQKLHGYVHDELAAFSGGVQGNAGLFSNARDVAVIAQMLLNGGSYGGVQIISPATTKLFTESRSASRRRGLGFDLLIHNRSMYHPKASADTYGHTGFTGTCYWIDPRNQIIVVFLSNRVNPSRDNKAWNSLNPRGAVVKAVFASLQD